MASTISPQRTIAYTRREILFATLDAPGNA
jgi:hypothetical protein